MKKANKIKFNWLILLNDVWWARRDSNPRPLASEANTLSS